MAVNKVTLTINSRQYTVVAEESVDYIEKLCEHINEKVDNVRSEGQNILGERPIVLAALNICDEYYKEIEAGKLIKEQMQKCSDKNIKLQQAVSDLRKELEEATSAQISIDETAMKAESEAVKNELSEANNQIKFLEGHITILENKIKELEAKHGKEVLGMKKKG